MAPAYCVGPICSSIEQFPSQPDLLAAEAEAQKAAASELTRLALTALNPDNSARARPPLLPGQAPTR